MFEWVLVGLGLFAFAFGMTHRAKTRPENLSNNTTRRRILKHVEEQPAANVHGICGALGLPRSTVQYHLYMLEQGGTLESVSEGRDHFYGLSSMSQDELARAALRRRGRGATFLAQILRSPGIRRKEIAQGLDLSRNQLLRLIRIAKKCGYVEERQGKQAHRYFAMPRLTQDGERVLGLACGPEPREPSPESTRNQGIPEGPGRLGEIPAKANHRKQRPNRDRNPGRSPSGDHGAPGDGLEWRATER